MVAPEDDDRIVFVGPCFQSVEQAPDHGVYIRDTGHVAMQGILPGVEFDQVIVVPLLAVDLVLADSVRQIVEIVVLHKRKLDAVTVVEVEVLFRAIVGKVSRVQSHADEEGLVMFPLQLLGGPVGPNGIGHFLFVLVEHFAPFEKPAAGRSNRFRVVNAIRIRLGDNGIIGRPRIQGPARFLLFLAANEEFGPAA